MKISESPSPKQDLGVRISWGIFASGLCLHCAADQGHTAEEIAGAKAIECEEGVENQRYLKIAEALKDHLKVLRACVALPVWSAVWGALHTVDG